jgi:phage-related protein
MPSPSVGSLEFTIQGKTDHAAKAVYALSESLKNLKSGLGKINATKALQSIAKLGDGAKKLTRSLAGVTKNIMLAPFKKFGDRVRSAAKSFNKFTSSLGRVFFYRAIRKLLSEIGDALKTGVNNLYGWSQIADGRFAASMDNIASSLLYFKNSIGAAVAPLINSFAPVLEFITDKAVDLLNVINQLLAKLTGASYWTKAVRGATSYGDAVSGAGDAAKEALRYLAPFDELNRLPADNGSSGGGASGGGTDYSSMFEIQNSFDQSVADFAEQIKNAWNTGDWEEVGTTIATKLNELIDNIPWKSLGTKVGKGINALFGIQYWTLEKTNFTNLGNKIAEFVNEAIANINFDIAGRLPVRQFTAIADTIIGFIYGLDGSAIGKAVADFVGGAISEAQTWLTETPFRDVGNKVGELITQVFSNINSVLEKTSLGTIGSAIARFINGVLEKTDWTEVGSLPVNIFTGLIDNIISFLDTLDWGEVTSSISGFIVGAMDTANDWFKKVDWVQLGTNLFDDITDAISNVKWGEIASSLFTLLGNEIRAGVDLLKGIGLNIAESIKEWWNSDIKGANFAETATNLWNAFIGALGNIDTWVKENIIDPFMEGLLGDDWPGIDTVAKNLWTGFSNGIKDFFADPIGFIKENIVDPFINGIKDLFGIHSPSTVMAENGRYIGEGLLNGIAEKFANIKAWVQEHILGPIQNAIDAGKKLVANVTAKVSEVVNNIKDKALDFKAKLTDKVDAIKDKIITGFSGTVAKITDGIKNAKDKVISGVSGTVGKITDGIKNAKDKVITGVSGTVGKITDGIKNAKDKVITGVSGTVGKITDGIKDAKNKVITGVSGTVGKITDGIKNTKDKVIGGISGTVSTVTDGIKNASQKLFTGFTAKFTESNNALESAKTTFDSTAKFQESKNGDKWTSSATTWNATAKFQYSKNGDKWDKSSTTWNATAKFQTSKNGEDWTSESTTWNSTARWKYYKLGTEWFKTADEEGGLKWDSTARFKWVDKSELGTPTIDVTAHITGSGGNYTMAEGGVFVNGRPRKIASYASGVSSAPAGQLFLAREAGPELVGTLRGHTAVMNNDQIVASVSAGVARAISSIQFHMTGLASSPLPTYTQDETTEDMLYNAFMRALADSNLDGGTKVYLDGEPLYQNMVRRNRMATRSTGSNPMLNNA